jgi:hypothetical protein
LVGSKFVDSAEHGGVHTLGVKELHDNELLDARLLGSCNWRVVNEFVLGDLGAVLWGHIHGGKVDPSGRGYFETHECLLDVAGNAEGNGVRDTIVLNGDANVLLEGTSILGDLLLLAKGRQEVLKVLVAGRSQSGHRRWHLGRGVPAGTS